MGKFFPVAAWGMMTAAKSCDSCKSAAAVLFCRTDSAFLCVGCDSRHHSSPPSTAARQIKHERVWMCEVCEQAPASFTCRADAAALCVTCDRDIHSANPLASRHERLPVTAFYETAESVLFKSSAAVVAAAEDTFNSDVSQPDPSLKICPDALFCDNDQFLDFDSYGSLSLQNCGSDSVVPVQQPPPAMMNLPGPADQYFEIDFSNPQSLSHSVSTSSMDVGIVPEGSSMSEISYPFGKNIIGSGSGCDLDGSSVNPVPVPAQGRDREARVMRYREKRKNRRFEKTIRYASRKAYAETRPRIKGRFAKRTDVDNDDMDSVFISGSPVCFLGGYGVVPSF